MILAVHQPIFLPWPGFFHKAMHADRMVLLDDVQYPRGRSWMNRNRLKNEDGELWLGVPVHKKGRGLQIVREVEIYYEKDWRTKHLRSIRQNYANAPFFDDYYCAVEEAYRKRHRYLADFNIDLARLFCDALSLKTKLVLQSETGVTGRGTDLLIDLCREFGADRLGVFPHVGKHIDAAGLRACGIEISYFTFRPPVYPQMWGAFIYNLSILDLLLNCGPKSNDILSKA